MPNPWKALVLMRNGAIFVQEGIDVRCLGRYFVPVTSLSPLRLKGTGGLTSVRACSRLGRILWFSPHIFEGELLAFGKWMSLSKRTPWAIAPDRKTVRISRL